MKTLVGRLSCWLLLFWSLSLTVNALNFKLHGINYTLRIGADWEPDVDRCKSYNQVVADLTQLQDIANNVRIFSLNDCNAGDVILQATLSMSTTMGVWLGLWVGPNGLNFAQEQAVLLQLLQTYSFAHVQGIHVSSEAIYRGDLTVQQAISYRNTIKADMIAHGWPDIPVVVADIIDNNIQYPQLNTLDNVVHFNQFPFWERSTNINQAATYMQDRVAQLQNVGTRTIVIGETGWADAGSNPAANPANAPSMRKWLRDFVCLAQDNGWHYYWFIAYDSDWRRVNDQDPTSVEGHFGIFDDQGNMKPFFDGFSIDCASPRINIDPNAVDFPSPTPPGATTTSAPTNSPTLTPTSKPTAFPTFAPTTTPVASTDAPTDSPTTMAPTLAPVAATETRAPTVPSDETIITPTTSPTDSPTSKPTEAPFTSLTTSPTLGVSDQCQDHAECADLALTGSCCPTIDNWMLDCCTRQGSIESASNDEPPSDQCNAHGTCRDLGLADACCPTSTGVYLDCCDTVPNDCHATGTCTMYSAVAYLAEQQQASASLSKMSVMPFVVLSCSLMLVGAFLGSVG